MSDHSLEIHYDVEHSEWAALYVDGQLEQVGDSYLAHERAFEILNVKTLQDDAFMRGQSHRDGVAKNLEEVEEYRAAREERLQRAEELRDQAAKLREEADRIEQEHTR